MIHVVIGRMTLLLVVSTLLLAAGCGPDKAACVTQIKTLHKDAKETRGDDEFSSVFALKMHKAKACHPASPLAVRWYWTHAASSDGAAINDKHRASIEKEWQAFCPAGPMLYKTAVKANDVAARREVYRTCELEQRIPGLTEDVYTSLIHSDLYIVLIYQWAVNVSLDREAALALLMDLSSGAQNPSPDYTELDLPRVEGGGEPIWWDWQKRGFVLSQTALSTGGPPTGAQSNVKNVMRLSKVESQKTGVLAEVHKPWLAEGEAWKAKFEKEGWELESEFPTAVIQADRQTTFGTLRPLLATLASPGATKYAFVAMREANEGETYRDETIVLSPFNVVLAVAPIVEEPPPKSKTRKKKPEMEEDEVEPLPELRLKVSLAGLDLMVNGKMTPAKDPKCQGHTFCTTDDVPKHMAAVRKAGTIANAGLAMSEARRAYPIAALHNAISYLNAQGTESITIQVDDDVPTEILNAILLACSAKTVGIPHKDRAAYLKARRKPRDEPFFTSVNVEVLTPLGSEKPADAAPTADDESP